MRVYAFTLVELLIALTLSLLLLLAVAELFQRVGGSMTETRGAMSTSLQINEAALLLRQDFERIPGTLPDKPKRIHDYLMGDGDKEQPNDRDGYLTIIEGPNTMKEHPFVDERNDPDPTVGDTDDVIAFTVRAGEGPLFRGIIRGEVREREAAEIVWFVRGNTLYRRVRLIDNVTQEGNSELVGTFATKAELEAAAAPRAGQYALVTADETIDGKQQRYDAVQNPDDDTQWNWQVLHSLEDLALRARRFGHDNARDFPHLLYDANNAGWYYLRMPTWEEYFCWGVNKVKTESHVPNEPNEPRPDMWTDPRFFTDLQDRLSGSLNEAVDTDGEGRHHRAGEDVVLTNVLAFDVQVWCSETKDFVDLGSPGTRWATANHALHGQDGYVWDSWTAEYNKEPPYVHTMESVRITIRCFDPASRVIKQVTVVHRF